MKLLVNSLLAASALLSGSVLHAAPNKPTVVLVHGAFADSSSWNGVISLLERDGFTVVAAANPLRGVKSDAQYISDIVSGIASPVVLVGHSYAGSVISEAAVGAKNVIGLVYVAAFAPDAGESAADLTGKFPGSTLAATLAPPVTLSSGTKDFYIQQGLFRDQFAADVPVEVAKAMAAGQRPITEAALHELSTEPAWRSIPSWFIYGDEDKNIPPMALRFMADRAHSKGTVVVHGASHVVMASRPRSVAKVIETATGSP